jgi:hypothetical protein
MFFKWFWDKPLARNPECNTTYQNIILNEKIGMFSFIGLKLGYLTSMSASLVFTL